MKKRIFNCDSCAYHKFDSDNIQYCIDCGTYGGWMSPATLLYYKNKLSYPLTKYDSLQDYMDKLKNVLVDKFLDDKLNEADIMVIYFDLKDKIVTLLKDFNIKVENENDFINKLVGIFPNKPLKIYGIFNFKTKEYVGYWLDEKEAENVCELEYNEDWYVGELVKQD